jgi:nucleotide-binding universal stress UspA family protein
VNPLTRVLVAVDFSEPARAAFNHALVLSRTHNADLTVLHAVPRDRSFESHAHERIAMIAALRQAAEAAGVRFEVSVQHGDPAGVILLHARARRPDVIVVGTHQRSGFDRFRLASVAETVTLQATQPVLVVPASPGGKSAESAMSFNSALVAIDFSAASISAVERALSLGNANGRVTLVHVVPSVSLASASRYTYHLSEPDYQRLLARDAWRRLQETLSATVKTSRKVYARVASGDPSTEIARIAANVDADLILVGVTSRGAIGRRIFGSTAARVIRMAGRLVLAIPARVDQRAVPVSQEDQPAVAA